MLAVFTAGGIYLARQGAFDRDHRGDLICFGLWCAGTPLGVLVDGIAHPNVIEALEILELVLAGVLIGRIWQRGGLKSWNPRSAEYSAPPHESARS